MRSLVSLGATIAVGIAITLLVPTNARACGLCGCALAPPGEIEFSSIGWDLPEPGTLRLSLETREALHTTQPHATVRESTFESRNSFFVAYTPHRFVTLQWLVPVVYRSVEQSDAAFRRVRSDLATATHRYACASSDRGRPPHSTRST